MSSLERYLPPALSLSRVILCPAIVYCYLHSCFLSAFLLLLAAAATDLFDGNFPFGQVLDPMCDKILALSCFALLMVSGVCPSWFVGLVFTVALFQASALLLFRLPRRSARLRLERSAWGKLNAALQFFWIAVCFADIWWRGNAAAPSGFEFFLITSGYLGLAALQTGVFFSYFFRYRLLFVPELKAC